MIRVLTLVELAQMRSDGLSAFETVDDYRSFALSMMTPEDVDFLCRFLDYQDRIVADRAITALFYWGGVTGVGSSLAKWIIPGSTGFLDFALAIARLSVIQAGDTSAFQALRGARDVVDNFAADDIRQYDLADVSEALDEIEGAFPSGTRSRADLESGSLWSEGAFLKDQLSEAIPRLNSEARIIWMLKAFPGAPSVARAVREYVGVQGIGVTAAHVLVGFFGEEIPSSVLEGQTMRDDLDLITMANVASTLERRTGCREYRKYIEKLARSDTSGRIPQLIT